MALTLFSELDSVVVVFKKHNGDFIDTVYKGKVDTLSEIENLPVKDWDGGPVFVDITGFKGNNAVYIVEKQYSGQTVDTTFTILSPTTTIAINLKDFPIKVGDSLPLPSVLFTPSDLQDKTLLWNSAHSDIVEIHGNYFKALKLGNKQVTVKLAVDRARSILLQITVTGGQHHTSAFACACP